MFKCRICFSNQQEFVNLYQKEEEYTIAHMYTECSGIEVRV